MSHGREEAGTDRPVAIVTGGLQGLGLGAARALLGGGFDVAIIDLAADPTLPDDLPRDGRCRYYQLDISDIDRHATVLATIASDFGRLDCLVNNAGIVARPVTDILDLDPVSFDRSVDVNLRGTFFLTQAFAKCLLYGGPVAADACRSIIIVTSMAAETVFTDRAQYCVTKAALSMVTKLFAARLAAHGIQVHEIRPGLMRTPLTASADPETIRAMVSGGRVPMARWGEPEDMGRVVLALASGAMPYVTGQAFWVAGGVNIARIV